MKKIFALLIITILMLTACQPTPEETVVQSKDKDLVAEVIEANEEENIENLEESKEIIEEQIEAINEHLSFEVQANDRVKIVVDADVEVPNYNEIPMVRVEPANFTIEHLEKLLAEVIGDNPVYYKDNDYGLYSKEEITDMLINLKALNQNNNLSDYSTSLIESNISFLEEIYSSARSVSEEELYDGTLIEVTTNKYYNTVTQLKSYLGKDMAASISLWQSYNKTKSQLSYENRDYYLPFTVFEPYEGIDADKIDMTYEECALMAENLIKAVDGEDSNMMLIESEIGYSLDAFVDYTKETSPQCYSFTFARNYYGVFAKPVNCLTNISNINYSESVEQERVTVMVDNDGIISFSWSNYAQYVDVVSTYVPLTDFETINSVFEDYCMYKFTWLPSGDTIPEDLTVTINIDRVELNFMMTVEKDDLESYILIPVWDYIGDVVYDQEVVTEAYELLEGQEDVAILTINAIDGTVIDREQGY